MEWDESTFDVDKESEVPTYDEMSSLYEFFTMTDFCNFAKSTVVAISIVVYYPYC